VGPGHPTAGPLNRRGDSHPTKPNDSDFLSGGLALLKHLPQQNFCSAESFWDLGSARFAGVTPAAAESDKRLSELDRF